MGGRASEPKRRVPRPVVPGGVALTPTGDGGYCLRPPYRGVLEATVYLSIAAIGCLCFPILLALLIELSPASLAGLAIVIGIILSPLIFLAGSRERWLLGHNRFDVVRNKRTRRFRPRFTFAEFTITDDLERRDWRLSVRDENGEQLLFRSTSCAEVVGMASCVSKITEWRVSLPAFSEELAVSLVTDAVTWNEPERLDFLLDYELSLPAVLEIWNSPLRARLRALLDQMPDLSARIIRGVHSPDDVVRASAIELLGQRRDPETAPWVRGALEDASVEVQRLAIIAAGRLRDLAAVPALGDLLHARNGLSVLAAATSGEIGDPGATRALCETLRADQREETWRVRASAADALAQIGDRTATQALCQALQDPEPQVRLSAAQALRKLADPDSVEPLGLALSDEDGDVASEAVAALGDIPGARSVALLAGALPFPDPAFRAAVLAALGASRDQEALSPLLLGLADSSAVVRRTAANGILTLAEIAGTAPLEFRKGISPLVRTVRASLGDRELRLICRRAITRIEEQTAGVKDLPLPSSPMEGALDNLPRVAASGGRTEPVIQRVSGNDS